MAPEDQPLWERVREAADTVGELLRDASWITSGGGVLWPSLPKVLHDAANRLQREAEEAAEQDQMIEDVAAFLYRGLVSDGDSNLNTIAWSALPAASPLRQKYRNVATHMWCAFTIGRAEAPF